MRSASEFRQMARETLRGNWKLAMGTGLAASLIGAEIADTRQMEYQSCKK